MALIDLNATTHEQDLHVDSFGLSVGSISVGLPMSCTSDTVLLRYLDLITLCDARGLDWADLDAHLPVLAGAVSMPPETVRTRLRQLSA